MASDLEPEAEVCFLRGWPPLSPWLGEECVLEGGGRGLCPGCSGGGGRPILLQGGSDKSDFIEVKTNVHR